MRGEVNMTQESQKKQKKSVKKRRISQSNSSNIFTPHRLLSPEKRSSTKTRKPQETVVENYDTVNEDGGCLSD